MAFPYRNASAPTVKSLEADAAKLCARRTEMLTQRSSAQSLFTKQQRALEQALIDGDNESAVTKMERSLGDAERRVDALDAAIDSISEQLAKKEKEIAKLVDSQLKERTATELHARFKRFEAKSLSLVDEARDFAEASGEIAPVIWEATPLRDIGQRIAIEVPEATARLAQLVADYINRVRNGAAPNSLPARAPAPEPVVAPPETAGLFAMRDLAWSEGAMIRVHPRGWPVNLPIELAGHAVAIKAALPPGHYAAAELAGSPTRSRQLPRLVDCVALDDVSAEAKEAACREAAEMVAEDAQVE